MKKVVSFLFICIALSLLLIGCSSNSDQKVTGPSDEEKEYLNDTGMPIVEEEIELEFLVGQAPETHPDWNESLLFTEYQKETNMKINFRMVPRESLEEQRNLALGGGSLPDAFHNAGMPVQDIIKYGEQGIFISLNDLIEDYAPNLSNLMEEYPEVRDGITMPDGNIYTFPQMADPEFLSIRMGAKPFIRQDWLEVLDMDIPKTTDEYYEYLKAVKEEKPSGGEIDEVPFGGPSIDNLYGYLRGSFGLANKGATGGLVDIDPETDDYRFWPTSDSHKEMLEYLNRLFSEELIEKNIFSIEHTQFLANQGEGKYGSIVWYSPLQIIGKEMGSKYTPLPALEGPHGDKMWTGLSDAVLNPGSFVITSDNKYPAATVRWIDHFYGDDGLELFFMGIEGETFEYVDGEAVYMDHILNSADGLSLEQEVAKYLTFPGGGYPSMLTLDYFQGAEAQPDEMKAAELLEPDLIKDPWVSVRHTNEETEKLRGFGADLEKYVEEMRDKFISGQEDLQNWDDFVKEVDRIGLEDYMKLKIDAIERQNE